MIHATRTIYLSCQSNALPVPGEHRPTTAPADTRPRRCLSIPRICSACSVFALRSTYSVQGHVWQPQRAACLTRMTWFCIRCLRGASASSIPRCAQKALRPGCCISAISIAGSPLKESGLPSTGMMCSGPLDFTLLPEMTKSSPPLWLAKFVEHAL